VTTPPRDQARLGIVLGVAAYSFWGVIPLYWRLLHGIDPIEIVAHRIVWGLATFVALAAAMGAWPAVIRAARDRRAVRVLLLSSALLSANWSIFIYAVSSDHVLHASLGYFINPLVSVLLGMVVLGERLRRLQWVAVALAAAGVVQITLGAGGLPWIAVALALTFGGYGLLRKVAPVDALAGSTVETALVAPVAAGYLVYLAATGRGVLGHAEALPVFLVALTGLVTAVPLVWFTAAARRVPLSTLGLLQYLAPTGQLFIGVLIFREPFDVHRLAAFACIWAGLAVFSADLLLFQRARAVAP